MQSDPSSTPYSLRVDTTTLRADPIATRREEDEVRVTGGRTARLLSIAALAAVAVACVPVTPPPPPQPTPTTKPKTTTTTLSVPPLAAPPPDIVKPQPEPTLTIVDLVSATARPWDIAFLPGATGPEGGMLYTENNTGIVKAYVSAGVPGRELVTIADVNDTGEGGLMGIAVHPTQPWVYVCYTSDAGDNRVVRYVLSTPDLSTATLGSPDVVVDGMSRANFHDGCRIRFQPGSSPPALFVTMGDAGIGSLPQSDASSNGKVLRVTEDGAAYPGNASGSSWYTKGHRNPQGVAFRPGTDAPYSSEHGPNINDEINALVNGANAGWDPVPGYTQSVPMTDLAKFPTAMRPKWRSGDGRTIAISGIDFLESGASDWKAWNGALVSAQLKDQELRLYTLDGSGNITGQVQIHSDPQRLRVPVLGPDGKLYVATDSDAGRIIQITPS
jgi:glucose/arabinose dehydrogenase